MIIMVLTFIQIFKWIQIATVDGFEIDENGSSSNIYEYANKLVVYLDEYKQVVSMLVIFCFLKIMKYIDFSYKLSIFYETIKESSYDLIFFISSYVIILLGFSLIGNYLFGLVNLNFSQFNYSFMTIFELICGGLNIESIASYNKIILYIYGLSFTFISILLFSTLTAIISSHYFEYYANQGDLNANFIKLFLKNFISKEGSDGPIEHLGFFKSIFALAVKYIKRWVWSIQEKKSDYKETPRCKSLLYFEYIFCTYNFAITAFICFQIYKFYQ